MALDVTICNKFSPNSNTDVCYEKNSDTEKCLNPGECSDPPISLAQDDCSTIFDAGKLESLKINAKNSGTEIKFQIGLKEEDGNPKVKIQRSDKKWTLINAGANTSVQVGAGPDGQ